MKKITTLIAICALAVVGAMAESLVILHTNDTHSQIDPDDMDGLGGVARRKVVIDSVRAADKNVLVVDAGDVVQGTLYFNLYGGEVEEMAMNEMGYDLRILGNHEFDNGMEALASNAAMSNAKLLATNYGLDASLAAPYFDKYAVYDFDGHRIGFMGINLEPKGMIAEGNYDGVVYRDAIKAANATARYLKDVEGAERVIAITHIGYDEPKGPVDPELIEASTDIDVVIGGHSHNYVFPAEYNKKYPSRLPNADGRETLVTQMGKAGKYVGRIEIDLDDPNSRPEYSVIQINNRLDDRLDQNFLKKLEPYRHGVDSLMTHPIAYAKKELDYRQPALQNFLADFMLDAGRELADNVDLGIINKGGIRRSLPKGAVSEGMVLTMLPFSNRPLVVEMRGDSLWSVFQTMAKTHGDAVSGNVEAVYNPTTLQLKSVKIDGKPLDMNKTYRVATIDYLANGGDYMQGFVGAPVVARDQRILNQVLLEYLAKMQARGQKINPSGKVRFHP